MASRRPTPLLAVVVGLLLVALTWLAPSAVGAQDVPSTTVAPAPGATTTTTASNQTLVETAPPPERRLASESRRVMAIIGALVAVALALAILTVRYWRHTKPDPSTDRGDRAEGGDRAEAGAAQELDDDAIFTAKVPAADGSPAGVDPAPDPAAADAAPARRSRRSVAGADHAGADTDWEPRGTGEHATVVAERPAVVRPGRAARKVALSRPEES